MNYQTRPDNFKRHVNKCKPVPKDSLTCDVCFIKFKKKTEYQRHFCKRQQPSPDAVVYKLQKRDGPLKDVILTLDFDESLGYDLCYNQNIAVSGVWPPLCPNSQVRQFKEEAIMKRSFTIQRDLGK